MPLGFSPNGKDFLPSGAVTSATTKSQVPTICRRRLLAGSAEATRAESASVGITIATLLSFMFLPQGRPALFGFRPQLRQLRLDQRVERVLVEHAGLAEGRGGQRIDNGIVNLKAAFAVLAHPPLDQLLVGHDFRETLEPEAQAQEFPRVRKLALHRAHSAK